jgi:hypothetical protein
MPSAAAVILATLVFDMIVSAAAIGIAFFVILRRLRWRISPTALVPALLALFAFLDLVWWPAAVASSATVTIHNAALASFFGIQPDTPVESLLGLGLLDLLGWFIQVGVALWVAYRLGIVEPAAA